ncbi:MAG: DoxX family protein [Actinomycetota bacterium]|nr:DoxX family protein [Actinomycetota bacterium]
MPLRFTGHPMTLSRRIARPLLGSIFITGGLSALRDPEARVPTAERVVRALPSTLPLPSDTASVVRANAAVQVGAGLLLSMGRVPRLAALALLGSLIPTTVAGHRFWEESEPSVKGQQKTHFFKNLAIIGGLVIAAVDTEGSPSLGYRARRRTRRVATAAGGVLPGSS